MLLHRIISDRLECGTDEAGRGCLAGPVTAAAVILPEDFEHELLNDSKKLTLNQRLSLRTIIEEKALACAVAHISPERIDEINILNASILAMHEAIGRLNVNPEFILVDGNKFKPYNTVAHMCVIKGDAKYMNIAAASILAKTYRDELMQALHHEFPVYDWSNNKGYPTKKHREAIKLFGHTDHHRQSFKLVPEQLKLNFNHESST
jgi:ribonuclease HII